MNSLPLPSITKKIQELFPGKTDIHLHEPCFIGNEKKYLADCIDSTFVSYIGQYVNRFEQDLAKYTGSKHAVVVTSGTVALQVSLLALDIPKDSEVIVPALTFVATANAITHAGAVP